MMGAGWRRSGASGSCVLDHLRSEGFDPNLPREARQGGPGQLYAALLLDRRPHALVTHKLSQRCAGQRNY